MKIRITRLLIYVILILFTKNIYLYAFNLKLKEIIKIGSDKQNYEFFNIVGVCIDKSGNIYIADSDICTISKYSKEGIFIKKIGKCGQGPGDFGNLSIDLKIKEDSVYVQDFKNSRIEVLDFNLNYIKYIKLLKPFWRNFFIINSLFYGPIFISKEDKKRIYVCDKRGKFKFSFFDKYPDYINVNNKDRIYLGISSLYSSLIMDYNRKRNNFVISFYNQGRKLVLYYYNPEGKFIREQSFEILKDYKFPKFLLKYPPKYPNEFTIIKTDSIHYYKNKYVILHYVISKGMKQKNGKIEYRNKAFIILIDIEKGIIKDKIKVNPGFRILKIKGDYLYAKNFNDEIEKLHIYKIEGIK